MRHFLAKCRQDGSSLLDTLVAITLLGLLGMSFMKSMNMFTWVRGKSAREAVALEFAIDKLEQLTLVDPESLTDADDSSELVSKDNMAFTRVTDITVNSNGSRTVDVTVTGNTSKLGGKAELTTQLLLRGVQ